MQTSNQPITLQQLSGLKHIIDKVKMFCLSLNLSGKERGLCDFCSLSVSQSAVIFPHNHLYYFKRMFEKKEKISTEWQFSGMKHKADWRIMARHK